MKSLYIYLDDLRSPDWQMNLYFDKVVICRSFKSAVAAFDKYYSSSIDLTIDLDHDLGEDKSGYDFCKYLIEKEIIGKFHIHSMNAVGVENMRQLLSHYGWREV